MVLVMPVLLRHPSGISFNINSGSIPGNNNVGGIIGEISYNNSTLGQTILSNNLNSGVVEGNSNVGCIIENNVGNQQ
jgi:hypothetical protein